MRHILLPTILISALLCGTASAQNLLFILDASGSMWGKVGGETKIETAKRSLSHLISDLPSETKVGLMAYGHREKGSCTDVEVLLPVGQATAAQISDQLERIVPVGKTPIAYSLEQTADAFVGLEEGSNNVVLISDGIETCDGDPCAVAGTIANSSINVRVHVVGFDIARKDREQLECIAKLGKGEYFAADSIEGFAAAVTKAVKVAQAKPAPAPVKPERKRVFFDDFDGAELGGHWTVNNPNPDAYLVEDGKLLMFSSQTTGFDQEKMPNLITLNEEFPSGDWDAIVRFSGEFKTGRDQFWFGLRKDRENFLSADVSWYFRPGSDNDYVTLRLLKHSKGAPTDAPVRIYASNAGDAAWEEYIANFENGISTLTLSKRGRNYHASFTNEAIKDDDGKPTVWQTDKLTSLRLPGQLTLGVSKWGNSSGEVLTFIESVEVVTVEE